jgi:tetratricopeptide (TPR) repeat protein
MPDKHELYAEGEKLKDDGKNEEAIAKFLEALQVDETFALPHFALAVLYGKMGDHEKAVKHGERACELDPSDPFSFTAMSVTYLRAFEGTQNPEFKFKAEQAMAQAHGYPGAN